MNQILRYEHFTYACMMKVSVGGDSGGRLRDLPPQATDLQVLFRSPNAVIGGALGRLSDLLDFESF